LWNKELTGKIINHGRDIYEKMLEGQFKFGALINLPAVYALLNDGKKC